MTTEERSTTPNQELAAAAARMGRQVAADVAGTPRIAEAFADPAAFGWPPAEVERLVDDHISMIRDTARLAARLARRSLEVGS